MANTANILNRYGGTLKNNLNNILCEDSETHADNLENSRVKLTDIVSQSHSRYLNDDDIVNFCKEKRNELTIFNLNVQSLNAKFAEIKVMIETLKNQNLKYSVLAFQETWLSEVSDTSLFQLEGYKMIHLGYICSSHSGLALYISDEFDFKVLPLYNKNNLWEGLFIEISRDSSSKKVVIGNIYRPPGGQNQQFQQFMDELNNVISGFDISN